MGGSYTSYLRVSSPIIGIHALQWAERLMEGGGNEQWGENWVEDFKDGAGSKKVGRFTAHAACCAGHACAALSKPSNGT